MVPPPRTSTWTDTKKIVTGRSPHATHLSLYGIGVKGSLLGRRADLVILDDVVSEKNSASKALREFLSDWLFKVLVPVLDVRPGHPGQLIVIGTPFYSDDLYSELSTKWDKDKNGSIEVTSG